MKLRQKIWQVKLDLPKMRKETEGFNFKYVNLEDIENALLPILAKHGLGFSHRVMPNFESGGVNVLRTNVFDIETNEEITSEIVVPSDVVLPKQNTLQALGSAFTYYRRYNLVIMFDILGTDNDVDAINAQTQTTTPEPTRVDYVGKVKTLIAMGRDRANLERYFQEYESKMDDKERIEIIDLINTIMK